MTIPIWLFCILAVPALVGTLALARTTWLTIKHLRMKKVRAHPLAMRNSPNAPKAQPLLDEPPSQCPTCETPSVSVARSDFTPKDSHITLPDTEHFHCENGHRWFGPAQMAVMNRRLAARRRLAPDPTPESLDDAAAKLRAKVKLLDVDSTKT